MTLLMRDQENIERGIKQGLEQGLQQGLQQGLEQGIEQGIRVFIEMCQEFALAKGEVCQKLLRKFKITEGEAREYIEKYWK